NIGVGRGERSAAPQPAAARAREPRGAVVRGREGRLGLGVHDEPSVSYPGCVLTVGRVLTATRGCARASSRRGTADQAMRLNSPRVSSGGSRRLASGWRAAHTSSESATGRSCVSLGRAAPTRFSLCGHEFGAEDLLRLVLVMGGTPETNPSHGGLPPARYRLD